MSKNVELSDYAYEMISAEISQSLEAIRQCDGFRSKEDKKTWKEIAEEFDVDWDDYEGVQCEDDDSNCEALDMDDETGYPGVSNPRGFKIEDFE